MRIETKGRIKKIIAQNNFNLRLAWISNLGLDTDIIQYAWSSSRLLSYL